MNWETHNDKGKEALSRGLPTVAERHLQEALFEATRFGLEDLRLAETLRNLAKLYRLQGQLSKAEPLCEQALEIRQTVRGPGHPEVAGNLAELARIYRAQGKYSQAEALYDRASAIVHKRLGEEHVDTAAILNDIAGLYRTQGRYQEAELLVRKCLEIWTEKLGASHPYCAIGLECARPALPGEG